MADELQIGLVGLDTSHVAAFTKLLNDAQQEFHVPGGRVVAAFAGGSPDFELSHTRVEGFARQLRDEWGVQMLASPAAVAEKCDAVLLTSVDGRAHLAQFRDIAPFGKPTFIDKPFATSSQDAQMIADLARSYGVRLMSCSTLRYAQPLVEALQNAGPLIGADCCGPMNLEPTQPGLFWYGIHSVEMLYAALGAGCERVSALCSDGHEFVTGVWRDGRIGTVRGYRGGKATFGALLHEAKQSHFVDAYAHAKPGYAGLLEQIMPMFQGANSPIEIAETLEIIRFIEAANQSRDTGASVRL